MPNAWPVKRKNISFVTRSKPGSHRREYTITVVLLLRDVLKYVENTKEAKFVVNNQEVKVNDKVVKSIKHPVGLFDILEFPTIKEKYTILFDENGKVKLTEKKDNNILLKVTDKKYAKGGKLQLNTMNGYNIFVDEKTFKKVNRGDTISYDPSKKKVSSVVPLSKDSFVYVYDGKYTGKFGKVVDFVHFKGLSRDTADIEIEGETQKTLKEYCFPVGLKEEEVKALQ